MANETETQREIDQMNRGFSDLYGEGNEQATDAPATEVPVAQTDAPATDAPTLATDAPATDVPATESPATEAPAAATDAPATEVPDERDQTIIDLRAKLAEKETKKPSPTAAPTTLPPLELESQDFIGDTDVENLTKETLNELFNSIYSKGITDARSIINKGVSGAIPSIVSDQVGLIGQMKEIKENFYSNNADLKPFPKVVAAVFDDMAKGSPDEPLANIIESIGPEVRKRLGLGKQTKPKNDKGNPPNLPRKKGKSGRSQTTPEKAPIESELDEMNKTLGR